MGIGLIKKGMSCALIHIGVVNKEDKSFGIVVRHGNKNKPRQSIPSSEIDSEEEYKHINMMNFYIQNLFGTQQQRL